MSNVINQGSQKKKFGFLLLLLVVLCAVPFYLYVQSSYKSSQAVSRIVSGVEPIKAVLVAIDTTQQHRGLTSMVLNGNVSTDTERTAKQQELARAYKRVDEVIGRQNNKQLAEKWQTVNAAWPAIADKIGQKKISAKESFAAHSQLIAGLQDLNELLLKDAGLNKDSDVGNQFMVKAALVQSPELVETMARLRGQGAGLLSARTMSQDERMKMAVMYDRAQALYEEIAASQKKAAASQNQLDPVAVNSHAEGMKALSVVKWQILMPEKLSLSSAEYFAKMTAAIDAQTKLNEDAFKAMVTQFKEREQRLVLNHG